jgi:hypothetical protein
VKDNIWLILALTPGVFSAHYSIEYRSHFTKWHITVVGLIGATEQLVFLQLGTICNYFSVYSNDMYSGAIPELADFKLLDPILGRPINYGDCVVCFAMLSGIHFNSHNMISAFIETDTKCYALKATIPYI